MTALLLELLQRSAARHSHLCPRQVLGVRIGLAGVEALDIEVADKQKRLFIFVETDGCFVDGIEVATGCRVGHRTLRVVDYGKIAATFVDVYTEKAVRVTPVLDARERARNYAPEERRRYFAQLHAYQVMPADELLTVRKVSLRTPVQALISRAGIRVNCDICGEEIINEREIQIGVLTLCLACAGRAYYRVESQMEIKEKSVCRDPLGVKGTPPPVERVGQEEYVIKVGR